MGITQDMLDAAQDIGRALERTNEGLKVAVNSLETQQRFARRLDMDANELYERAKEKMSSGDEESARNLLFDRQQMQDKLKQVLVRCAEEKKRIETMESNVSALERRAMEVDSLLRRSVGAKAIQTSANSDVSSSLSLSHDDPLLRKFRDLGID